MECFISSLDVWQWHSEAACLTRGFRAYSELLSGLRFHKGYVVSKLCVPVSLEAYVILRVIGNWEQRRSIQLWTLAEALQAALVDPTARPERSGAPVAVSWGPEQEMKGKKLHKPCRLLSTGLKLVSRRPCPSGGLS